VASSCRVEEELEPPPPPGGRGFRVLGGIGFEEEIGEGRFYRDRLGFVFDRDRWYWRC
jgi:hypothetical protein